MKPVSKQKYKEEQQVQSEVDIDSNDTDLVKRSIDD